MRTEGNRPLVSDLIELMIFWSAALWEKQRRVGTLLDAAEGSYMRRSFASSSTRTDLAPARQEARRYSGLEYRWCVVRVTPWSIDGTELQ